MMKGNSSVIDEPSVVSSASIGPSLDVESEEGERRLTFREGIRTAVSRQITSTFLAAYFVQGLGAEVRPSMEIGVTGLSVVTAHEGHVAAGPFVDPRFAGRVRLAHLKERHFTPEGREQRIAKALQALNEAAPSFVADSATWKWAAQEADIENM
ncbi:MAG: hypothetical protein C3F08_02920 [Candidatus Methylomirabilota bacterium]|nr:MAG: hypothetical protein C3F08_02920 [candidate division NC10 bacterium]